LKAFYKNKKKTCLLLKSKLCFVLAPKKYFRETKELKEDASLLLSKNSTATQKRQLGHADHRMLNVYVNLVGRDLKEAHAKYSPVDRMEWGIVKPIIV
jgi:hypothetical protein